MSADPQTPPQAQPVRPNDMMLRLQIGAGGVLAVLLLVGLAGIIGDRAADQAVADGGGAPVAVPSDQTASDQPLVDLGVRPSSIDPAAPAAAAQPQPQPTVTDLPAPKTAP